MSRRVLFLDLASPPLHAAVRLWVAAVILLAALSLPPIAQAEGGPGDLWQTFTVRDGLRSGNVSAVFAAPDGLLWFGTDTGVSYYDGHYWKGLGEAEGLPADRVRAITQTKDGALWFATRTAGLGRRSPNGKCCQKWNTTSGLPSNDVRSLLPATVSPDGSGEPGIWVGTAQGLVYVDGERLVRNSPLADAPIFAMTTRSNGALLVATGGRGVWERGSSGAWQTLEGVWPTTAEVFALRVDKAGRLWAGTQNGLFFYEAGAWQRFQLAAADSGPAVFDILQDGEGGLWAGADQGLFYSADPQVSSQPPTQFRARRDGLVNDYVRAMAFAPDGALWLGTIAGVSRYAGAIWQTVESSGLAGQRINTILSDSRGRTWIGTEQVGLAVWDGKKWQRLTERDGLTDRRIVSLAEDNRGRIWVGAGNDIGYLSLDGKWQFFGRAAAAVGLPVYSFAQDAAGGLWLAAEGGVARWDEMGGLQPVPAMAGKRVNAIHRDRTGALWFGLPDEGVRRLAADQTTWIEVQTASAAPLKGIVVNGIAEGPDGSLWGGTGNDGLWRYEGGSWRRSDAALPSPKLLTLNNAAGHLLIGTYAGLSRFDGRTWQTYAGDVLPSLKVLAAAPGADGAIWIGTEAGLVRYRPERVTPWARVETVNLQAVNSSTVTLPDGRLQVIRLDGGDLGTQFEHLLFLLQLVGGDLPSDTAERVLTDPFVPFGDLILAPGSYVLRAQARDADFNYSAPVEVTLAVPPPRPTITLPGGRRVPTSDFVTVLFLGLAALGGLGGAGGLTLRARANERRRRAESAGRAAEALARHFNPYICGEPVRQAEMFFARDELLNKIFSALHQNSIMVHGERRMGKTSLLYQLAQRLRQADDPEWVFVPVLIDLEGTPQEQFFHLLMDGIWGVLRGYLIETPPELRFNVKSAAEYTDRDFTGDLRLLLDALKVVVAPRNVRVVLLLDEMDVVSHYDNLIQQQLRRIFMSSLAVNLGAVVAGVHISKVWHRLESPWYNLFNEASLEPFSPISAAELLTEPVKGSYTWDADALAFVVERAEGRPFRLQQYGMEAVNHMLAEGRTYITLADARAAHQTIEKARAG